jgi:hypothetical protein
MRKSIWKVLAISALGGSLLLYGSGSCLPYNFYSSLLGDSIIATFIATLVGNQANAING